LGVIWKPLESRTLLQEVLW